MYEKMQQMQKTIKKQQNKSRDNIEVHCHCGMLCKSNRDLRDTQY